jgi:large subunit ribosomal protein L2
MPKRIDLRRRGKGKPKFKSRTFRSRGKLTLPQKAVKGRVIDLLHDNVKSAPLMLVDFKDETVLLSAPLGIRVGDTVSVKELKELKEGTEITNVESVPQSGPKFARSSGVAARVVSKDEHKVVIALPSKKTKVLTPTCRAVTGKLSGGGRKEKPLLKAGNAYYAIKSKGIIWPRNAASARNPVDHPFGGGDRRPGKHKTISKRASPGRKVGSIAARRTGKKK